MCAEQASTTEMRESSRMCWSCKTLIELGKWQGGERLCNRCAQPQKVWLRFKYEHTYWYVEFLEPKHRMTIGRKRRFDHADTIREMVARTTTRLNLTAQQAFDFALQRGEGQIELELTGEQFIKLKR
jgi:hypothetical protein